MDPDTKGKEKEKEIPQIRLRDADGIYHSVPKSVAMHFGTVKNLLEDCGEFDAPIEFKSISNRSMGLIVEFATHYEDLICNPYDKDFWRNMPSWDSEFFYEMPMETTFDLMCAANFLDYEDLLVMTQKLVAIDIHALTPGEIKQKFGIENVMESEEKRSLKRKR